MKLKILHVKKKNFTGDDGEEIKYFWYTAKNLETGFVVKFGSSDGGHSIGETYEIELLQDVNSKGKAIFKEFVLVDSE